MKTNLLLIGAVNDGRLLKELKSRGCAVRRITDLSRAQLALGGQSVDLAYIHLPQQAASLRLARQAAKAGVPALIVALSDHASYVDATQFRPAVVRFVGLATPPGVVRRAVSACLEDLEAHRRLQLAQAAALAWPVAIVSTAGKILFASPEGSKAVAAVSAPATQRPVLRLDTQLIQRVQGAVKPRKRAGQVALFRRDGVLSHYETHVRRIEGGHLGLLMLDARDLARTAPAPTVISLVRLLKGQRKRP